MPTPEDKARENIDCLLAKAGWAVHDKSDANIFAYRSLAIRNFATVLPTIFSTPTAESWGLSGLKMNA
jgi:hypothetical protein